MSGPQIPRNAALLGYAGIIPFAALAALYVIGFEIAGRDTLSGFVTYGAVILSFLGGIRWGSAVAAGNGRSAGLGFSVLPSLWAFFFLWWAEPTTAAWGMFAGFVLLGLADGFFLVPGLPAWMRRLRLRLTAAVAVCHLPVLVTLQFS
jgi:hypothetical protein